jgi:hypothetical protein
MTKSRSQRRRSRSGKGGMGMSVPYGRHTPNNGVRNWQITSQQLTATGQIVGGLLGPPTVVPIWNPGGSGGAYTFATGVPQTFQVAVIQPGTTPNIPGVGRQQIDRIKGKLHLSGPSSPMYVDIAVGIYVSEFTVNTSAWDVLDPMTPTDASRDEWWFLEAYTFLVAPQGVATAPFASPDLATINIDLSERIVIGAGQAVNLTVTFVGNSSSTMLITPSFRTLVGPVA